ncbi:MAG TPA: hypothetical protein PLS81_09220 [Deltaproteobacteria bacterium]|nr:hypothetical protein [Deltaproteobacteria bacterium]
MKNGQSAPSSLAISPSARVSRPARNSSFMASRTPDASLLPPPSPEPTGTLLCIRIRTPPVTRVRAKKRDAAFHARFSFSAHPHPGASRWIPEGAGSISKSSPKARGTMMVRSSWYPSGLLPITLR